MAVNVGRLVNRIPDVETVPPFHDTSPNWKGSCMEWLAIRIPSNMLMNPGELVEMAIILRLLKRYHPGLRTGLLWPFLSPLSSSNRLRILGVNDERELIEGFYSSP
jgi:hypothetical protein